MHQPATILAPITPSAVRYIKLGPGSRWADRCLRQRELHFGDPSEPHDLCLAGDWEGVRAALAAAGKSPQAVTDTLRELKAFYTLPEETLWITLAEGRLWWAFATPEVIDLRTEPGEHGAVMRRVYAWHGHSILGEPLDEGRLSTRLTQLKGYRRTICQVEDREALVRLINGLAEPALERASAAKAGLQAVTGEMLERLHWRDFEILADLLLARSGWQRISGLGGTMADADLIVEQPATGERALVQVKSSADEATLERYADIANRHGYDRLFFVCHSPKGQLRTDDPLVHVWTGDELVTRIIAVGLFDWLVEHSR